MQRADEGGPRSGDPRASRARAAPLPPPYGFESSVTIHRGAAPVIEMLLAAGADADARTDAGRRPRDMAP